MINDVLKPSFTKPVDLLTHSLEKIVPASFELIYFCNEHFLLNFQKARLVVRNPRPSEPPPHSQRKIIESDKPSLQHHSSCTPGDIPSVAIEDGKVVVCGAHTDSTILTLLETSIMLALKYLVKVAPGLPWSPAQELWLSILVTCWHSLLEANSRQQRVVDLGKDRYSVPFFLEPNYHADIGKPPISQHSTAFEKYMPQGVSKDGSECKYGHWLIETYKKKKYVEFVDLEVPNLWFEQLFAWVGLPRANESFLKDF